MQRNARPVLRVLQRRHQTLSAVNPYTGEVAWEYPQWGREEGMRGLGEAEGAFRVWRSSELDTRSAFLKACSAILNERAEEFGAVMATEMGKPLAQGIGEAKKCATITDYYAEQLYPLLQEDPVALPGATQAYVTKQPLGVVLLIMPWNFPFWQVFRQASAAFAAGNVIVCKHAPNVPKCAALIQDVFRQAAEKVGVSGSVYVNLPMAANDIGGIMNDRAVRAISLTGSSVAGKAVGAIAGKLLKPSVLELGGNDPSLVLHDADLQKAARCAAAGRMLNAGQSCIGSKRFVVVDSVYDEFLANFVTEMQKFEIGDPQDMNTTLGTMVSHEARDQLHEQTKATSVGASVVLGGEIPDHPGAFYPATVISDVQPGTPGYEDELFGPVASVIRVKDEAEAIAVANNTKYGLGASVYTEDLERGNRIARDEIDTGMVFVNDFVKSSPLLPFGGVKESGYGRECGSYGIAAFCNIKSVVVA